MNIGGELFVFFMIIVMFICDCLFGILWLLVMIENLYLIRGVFSLSLFKVMMVLFVGMIWNRCRWLFFCGFFVNEYVMYLL